MATSPTLFSFFLLTLPLLLLIPRSSAVQCHPGDRRALLQMKADYGNPTSLADWNSNSTDCCDWTGIDCEGTGRVSFIFTYYANLSGPISPAIIRLTSLTAIRLDGNSLTGPIPAFLSQLKNLSYLHLASNKLSGPIPAFLAELPLTLLQLNSNHLTGTIPAFLGQSSILDLLYLDHNSFTGTIPASFAGSRITYLHLDNNQLTGDASLLFGRPIRNLYLQRNRFKFNLSEVTFPTSLVFFDVHDNKVYGGIPKQINELKNLRYFNVSYNQLCGEIPITGRLGRIPQLKETAFAHNKCLCGSPLPACS